MERIEANKLIAVFMGFEDRVRYVGGENQMQKKISGNRFEMYHYDQLKYHEDWNWLMPVIDKIESLGYQFDILSRRCGQPLLDEEDFETFDRQWHIWLWDDYHKIKISEAWSPESKIDAAVKGAVEFVEWYNKNKKP